MIKADEDSMICDFAETYNIYDYKRLPVITVAALAVGLRNDSRIKMKLSGAKAPTELMLLAAITDRLSLLLWAQSKDAAKGRNKPNLILDSLNKKKPDYETFMSGEDFVKERNRLLGKEAD